MNPAQSVANPGTARLQAALALILFLVAATLPYLWLIENFGYDDILRAPAGAILAGVARGGTPLVLAWFAFAMSALLFIPVAVALARLGGGSTLGRVALVLGVASATAQAVGLLRWVLVVPALAASFVDPQASDATRDAVLVVFDTVHRFGGMVLGEMVGQLLLAAGRAWWRNNFGARASYPAGSPWPARSPCPSGCSARLNCCTTYRRRCRRSRSSRSPSWRGKPGSPRSPWRF